VDRRAHHPGAQRQCAGEMHSSLSCFVPSLHLLLWTLAVLQIGLGPTADMQASGLLPCAHNKLTIVRGPRETNTNRITGRPCCP